ncbi:MAG: nucleotidyltransferase family protein [Azoarcus sp.]|nr:nucleotidyltransferase family protein [Azoarcus sp.]
MSTSDYSLFGLVCAPRVDEPIAAALHGAVAGVRNWAEVLRAAGEHRLAPLLYRRTREAGVALPDDVRRALAAAYARQKAIASAQGATLAELGAELAAAGTEVVVLKGGALAHQVYSEPALRPMEDLDLLVAPGHGEAACEVLRACGFNAPPPHTRYDRLQHHFPIAHRTRDGITVSVEMHTQAFNLIMNDPLSMRTLERPLTSFRVEGATLQGLAPAQMMWMQYLGMRKLAEPLRLGHVADLAAIAARFDDEIDWPALRRTHPALWNAYRAIHAFTPLPAPLCASLGLDPQRPPRMRDIGVDYCGWPRVRAAAGIRATLLPPDWWARLVYGVAPTPVTRAWLPLRHGAAFVSQGLRRLYLGPVTPTNFFKTPG